MRLLKALLLVTFAAASLHAQEATNLARGFEPEKVYHFNDIDNVNLFNGNLIIDIPIGPTFPVGGNLSYNFHLVYNGNPWDYEYENNLVRALPSRFNNVAIGWQFSMGELVGPSDTLSRSLEEDGNWLYVGPDGSEHPFFTALHKEEENTTYQGSATPGENVLAGYTRDSTYLRLTRIANSTNHDMCRNNYRVDFPDGTRHYFESLEQCASGTDPGLAQRYRLYRIDTALNANNWVTVDYDSSTEKVRDSAGRLHTIYHWNNVNFFQYNGSWQARDVVSAVDLAGPQGQTSRYNFVVPLSTAATLPCFDTTIIGSDRTAVVPFLNYVERPDGTRFSMQDANGNITSYYSTTSDGCGTSAHIKRIDLPTGGRIEYDRGGVEFPFIPDPASPPQPRNPDDPIFRSSSAFATHSIGITGRRLYTTTTSTSPAAAWQYTYKPENRVWYTQRLDNNQYRSWEIPQEEAVSVLDPANNTTVHYFSVYRKELEDVPVSSCFDNGTYQEYGLPITHRKSSGGMYLSTESFAGTCTATPSSQECPNVQCLTGSGAALPVLKSTYASYETDAALSVMTEHWETRNNSRQKSSRTEIATNDTGSTFTHTDVVNSDFDGLGHYRTAITTSNIGGGAVPATPGRTVTTHYNPKFLASPGSYPGSAPDTYMIAPGNNWLTGVYDYVDTTQEVTVTRTPFDSADPAQVRRTARQEFVFGTNGFLSSRRTLANQTTRGCSDLLTVFTDDGNGNVGGESYYGGDIHKLGSTEPCAAPNPSLLTADYSVTHTYQYGSLATSMYNGSNFYTENYTIDQNTGLVIKSRDTALNETSYDYDKMYRIWRQKQPPDGAQTQIFYFPSPSFPTAPLSVKAVRCALTDASCSSPWTQQRHYYDGLGRLTQSKTLMPNGQWAFSEKVYDGLGRVTTAYQPEYRTGDALESVDPTKSTQYLFDFLGRPTTTTAPDGSRTEQSYVGSQQMDRKTYDSNGSATSGDNTVSEFYDGHGRLVAVKELSTPSGLTTSYNYDLANRLVDVYSSTQTRKFRYDDRGFMTSETHPELSAARTYSVFDSRGHAHHTEVGGESPLDYSFDLAERVTAATSSNVTLKEFAYGGAGAPANRQGRLDYAIRHNYVTDSSNYVHTIKDVTVKDEYSYDTVGRISQKATTLGNPGGAAGDQLLTQVYTRDKLGEVTSLSYPTVGTAPTFSAASAYTNGLLTGGSFIGNATSSVLTYHPTGMVNVVPHSDGTTDTIDADSMMARPANIAFSGFASCQVTAPDAYVPLHLCPGAQDVVTVPQADVTTYHWSITGGQIVSGADTNFLTFTAGSSGYVVLTLALTNSCGSGSFQLQPIQIVPNPTGTLSGATTISPGASTPLTVTLTGTAPWNLTWSDGTYQPNVTTSQVSHSVNPSTTTNYSVNVSDANYCTSTSNTVTVTVVSLSHPASVTAAATSSSTVGVSWTAVSGATSYVIFRDNVQVGTSTTNSFPDNGLAAATSYLYKVHAKNGSSESNDSPVDLATTVIFDDDPYFRIRGVDVTTLRTAVNAVRRRAGLGNYVFTDNVSDLHNYLIKGIHIAELLTALNAARTSAVLGLPPVVFADPNPDPATNGGQHLPVRRSYITQLRGGVQ